MTNEPAITITNSPDSKQFKSIMHILDTVFNVGGAYFEERLLNDSSYDPTTTWFATVNGEVASSIQIFPLQLRVGQTILKVGGIGSVGTHPNFLGKGLAQKILNSQCQWMGENDYDLGMLFAVIHPYYEKLGWRLIPEKAYLIEKPPYQAPSDDYEIIPFSSEHLEQIQAIYNQHNQSVTYTMVRDDAYWKDLINWPEWKKNDCLLLTYRNKIVAYGLIEKTTKEHAMLYELIYLPEAEEEVISLFTALCNLRAESTHIQAKLNADHKLYSYFEDNAATEVPMNYTMWKIVNLHSLIHKLLPELHARLVNSSLQHDELLIQLEIGDACFNLLYKDQTLSIVDTVEQSSHIEAMTLTFAPEEFIALIFFGGAGEQGNSQRSKEEAVRLALFPKQNATFYLTDKF